MPHKIYTGSFRELEERWANVVAELQRNDPLRTINVLIGSNILASYLKRRLASAERAVAGIRFFTFLDLTSRLAARQKRTASKPSLPSLGPSVILEQLLAHDAPEVFAQLSDYQGFREAMLETFRDLRDGGVGAEELYEAIQSGSRSPDRRKQLLGLADLYRAFRKRVGFFQDVDDDFKAAIRSASEAKTLLECGRLIVYGIYDCTGQQSSLLTALKDSLEMHYFIPFVDDSVSAFAKQFLDRRAEELDAKPEPLQTPACGNSLEHLAASGFGFSSKSPQRKSLNPDGSFALVSAPGESRVAVEVVREVFRAVEDGTISGFYEAAVIVRQPDTDIPVLTEILRLHKIPYFVHGGGSFAQMPLGKAVIALSGLQAESFSREAVLSAFELVSAVQAEDSLWDVDSWRALTNDTRFLGGLEAWDAGTQSLIKEIRKEVAEAEAHPVDESEDESDSKWQTVEKARRRLESVQSLRAAWLRLREAGAEWPASLPWQEWAHFLTSRLEPLFELSVDWQFFSTVLDELENLQSLHEIDLEDAKAGRTKGVSLDRVRSALTESILSLCRPIGRFQRSGINLLSTSAARGLRFPLVIVPGLDEGRFPAKLRQDPLLLDVERLRMPSLPLKSKRVEEERLLFDMAARSAEKRLVLMTSRLDEASDREKIPSQFFLRAASAIRGKTVSIREIVQGSVPGYRSVSLENPAPGEGEIPVDEGEIRLGLITAEKGTMRRKVLESLVKLESPRLVGPLAYDDARWTHALTSFDGYLRDPGLKEWISLRLGSGAGQVSASRMEEYAKCPYLFFLRRGMSLEAWEEPEQLEGMDPLERGRAVHSILEAFLSDYGGETFLASKEQDLQRSLESIANQTLKSMRPDGIPHLLWDIESDAILAMLRNWLAFEKERAQQGMLPIQMEQVFGKFGENEQYPIFRLSAGHHTFDFRGRIDRIDVSVDGSRGRVIDYKTGFLPSTMSKNSRTPLMSGERIQVAVYRGALSVLEEFKDLKSVEGEYLHLQPSDGQIVPCAFDDEELNEAVEKLPGILGIIGDGIENGVFFPRTCGAVRPGGHCNYCDFLQICGKDRMQREERKSNDPEVRKFMKIIESRHST